MSATWVVALRPYRRAADESEAQSPDVNGDGRADLLIGEYGHYALGNADQTAIKKVYRVPQPVGLPCTRPTYMDETYADACNELGIQDVGDVDGDGYGDLLAVGGEGELYLYRGEGSGTFTQPPLRIPCPSGSCRRFGISASGDTNDDGYSDFDLIHLDNPSLSVRYFGEAKGVRLPALPQPHEVTSQSTLPPGGIELIQGRGLFGDPAFGTVLMSRAADGPWEVSVRAAGETRPRWRKTWPSGSFRMLKVAVLGDVDGDGYADIAVGTPVLDGSVDLLRGQAYGFVPARSIPCVCGRALVFGEPAYVGDVNGDGFDDLIINVTDDVLGDPHVRLYLGGRAGIEKDPVARWSPPRRR